jgi:hypothetical protein
LWAVNPYGEAMDLSGFTANWIGNESYAAHSRAHLP